MIDWMKRRKRTEDTLAVYYRLYTRDRSFCVCEIHSKLGLGNRALALRVTECGESVISRHHTARAAQRTIEAITTTTKRRKPCQRKQSTSNR